MLTPEHMAAAIDRLAALLRSVPATPEGLEAIFREAAIEDETAAVFHHGVGALPVGAEEEEFHFGCALGLILGLLAAQELRTRADGWSAHAPGALL